MGKGGNTSQAEHGCAKRGWCFPPKTTQPSCCGGHWHLGGLPFSMWSFRRSLQRRPALISLRGGSGRWTCPASALLCSPPRAPGAQLVCSGRQTGTEPTAGRHRGSPRLQPLPSETQSSPPGASEAAQPPAHGLMASDDSSWRCFKGLCPGFSLAGCSALCLFRSVGALCLSPAASVRQSWLPPAPRMDFSSPWLCWLVQI